MRVNKEFIDWMGTVNPFTEYINSEELFGQFLSKKKSDLEIKLKIQFQEWKRKYLKEHILKYKILHHDSLVGPC